LAEKIFFIAGAQRCGTSYLAHALDRHPQIRMARPLFPEPKFFLDQEEFQKGKEYYLQKYFAGKKAGEVLGEKSTSYIESRDAALKIKQFFPDAKILISLRNPVDRAISNYYFSKANKLESRTASEVFLENKPIAFDTTKFSVSPFDYLGRGEYLKYIKEYIDLFGREKVKVLIFESILQEEKREWKSITDFLEVDEMIPLQGKINESLNKETIDPKIVLQLKKYFHNTNKELSNYLQTDLSRWNF